MIIENLLTDWMKKKNRLTNLKTKLIQNIFLQKKKIILVKSCYILMYVYIYFLFFGFKFFNFFRSIL